MKRHLTVITMLLLLGTLSWSQENREPFDIKKSREELEIMKGILNTTLNFYAQSSQKESSGSRFSNITAFYLAGQGAVFVIPSSGFRFLMPSYAYNYNLGPEFNQEMASLTQYVKGLARAAQDEASRAAQVASALSSAYKGVVAGRVTGIGAGIGAGVGSGVGGIVAPALPAPPAPPAAPAPEAQKPEKPESQAGLEVDREKLRKAVEEAQARVNSLREQSEANRQKLLQETSEVKVHLIETLANYGDSITTVKPDEYINLVFVTDRSNVISARKSWLTDYKAGRLSLEAFKQKVIQYTE
jgi:hypothetical protein